MKFRPLFLPATSVALLALGVLTFGQRANGQENPVFSSSQSPGYDLPSTSESAALEEQQKMGETSSSLSENPGDTPVAWWEGMEEVAIQSMKTKNYDLGVELTLGSDYDDNIYLTDPDTLESFSLYSRAKANFTYSWAKTKLALQYLPEYRWYDASEIDATFNQLAFASLTYSGSKAKLGVDARFSDTEGANVEVGERVAAQLFSVGLTGSYAVSLKTIVGAGATYYHDDYDSYNDREKIIADVYADYKVTPKTYIGVGAEYEQLSLAVGDDSDAISGLGRINWQMTPKLSFRGKGGVEFREYDSGSDQTGVVFALGVFYAPSQKNSLSLDVYRNNSPSLANGNQSFYSTGASASFSQELFPVLKFKLTGGYNNSSYTSTLEGDSVSPDSDFWFVRPQLTFTIFESNELNLYYQFSASEGGTVFDRNLVGIAFSSKF